MPKKKVIKSEAIDNSLKWEDGVPAGDEGDEAIPGEGVVAPKAPKSPEEDVDLPEPDEG